MANLAIPGMAVMYIWSTRDHAPAIIFGPSGHVDSYTHLKGFYSEAPAVPDSKHRQAEYVGSCVCIVPLFCTVWGTCVLHCRMCRTQTWVCVSTGWALNRFVAPTFGTAAVLAQGGAIGEWQVRCAVCIVWVYPGPPFGVPEGTPELPRTVQIHSPSVQVPKSAPKQAVPLLRWWAPPPPEGLSACVAHRRAFIRSFVHCLAA
jgi:hypothetical protein